MIKHTTIDCLNCQEVLGNRADWPTPGGKPFAVADHSIPHCCPESAVSSDCLIWTHAVNTDGYATTRVGHRKILVCRKLLGILDRPDLMAIHYCDVRRCVNPDHLRAGTASDNMQDSLRRGRFAKAKLQPAAVLDILQDNARGDSASAIAARHGVGANAVRDIISGRTWSAVGGHLRTETARQSTIARRPAVGRRAGQMAAAGQMGIPGL